tara:strand:+ start:1231 stop:2148 length:918 start_codon:yes stop_codon:yes gene_type:complete
MVILLGSTGYIAQEFKKQLDKLNIDTLCLSREEYNYYDLETLYEIVRSPNRQFLINCAGFIGQPSLDECENNQEETHRANVGLVRTISKACKMTKTPWAHISSSCIYTDESGAKNFTENDSPNFSFDTNNCNYYCGTKAEAERVIEEEAESCYIWRLANVFDEYDGPRNFLSKVINHQMIFDANNSFSHRGDFVKYCLALWQAKSDFGIYNVVNSGSISTKEISEKINKYLGINKKFVFFESQRQMLKLGAIMAPRSYCTLSNTKLKKALHPTKLRTARKALEDSLKNWVEDKIEDNVISKSFWD